ncbi:MAG: hypothetical protein OEW58_09005 [Gammaproteobacteria bacterium]|nr:hypothetical protein [Gammaproteobacteria bacterium]
MSLIKPALLLSKLVCGADGQAAMTIGELISNEIDATKRIMLSSCSLKGKEGGSIVTIKSDAANSFGRIVHDFPVVPSGRLGA